MTTLNPPLFISSRLMPAIRINETLTLSLRITSRDKEGRLTTEYYLDDRDSGTISEGKGPSSGCWVDETDPTALPELMSACLSFMVHHDEDGWCFPDLGPMFEDGTLNSEQFEMAAYELELHYED